MALTPLDARVQEAAGPSARAAPSRRLKLEAAIAAVMVVVALAVLARSAFGAYLSAPYADAVDWTASVFQAERTHAWLAYLWSPHTAQRIPLARLIEALNVDVVGGRWPTFLLGDAMAWLAGAAMLAILLAQSRVSVRTRVWIGAAAALVWTNAGLAEDFAFPVFSVYLLVTGLALAALASIQAAAREGLRSTPFWAALGLAALASGGNAAGLAVWPALFVVAALQGRDRTQLFAVLIAGVACITLMEAGLGVPSSSLGRDYGGGAGAHLIKVLTYACVFAGLPWSRSVRWLPVAAVAGAALWAFAGRLVLRARHERDAAAAPLVGAGVGLIVFGALTAALATLGRVDELPQAIVPTRYTPFAALLQIGVLLCCTPGLERAARPAWAPRAALGVLAVLVLSRDFHDSRVLLRTADRIRAASEAFDRTGQQGEILIYPDAQRAIDVRRALAARGEPH